MGQVGGERWLVLVPWGNSPLGQLGFTFSITESVGSICLTVDLLWVGLVLAVLLLFHPERVAERGMVGEDAIYITWINFSSPVNLK
jgi:hypothetical protein